jgi:hypothetical protein
MPKSNPKEIKTQVFDVGSVQKCRNNNKKNI